MKNKILQHLQANYCVKAGHPCNKGIPSTNMVYFTVASKDDKNNRGSMNDDEWATNVLKEIGEEYTTELFMLVIQTSNDFIKSINDGQKTVSPSDKIIDWIKEVVKSDGELGYEAPDDFLERLMFKIDKIK